MRSDVTKAFELLQSGAPTRVDEALELLQNTVFSFSMTVCGHREDAEDTMQDVLLKAIPYLGKFATPKALTTWLFKVARNRCWTSRRKSKFAPKEHLSLEELMPQAAELDHLETMAATNATPEKAAMATEDTERLQQAILQVPPAYRLILVLHDVEELTTDEIARILNLKQGTVRVRLHRARLFLRRELSRRLPGQPDPNRGAQSRSAEAMRPKRACSRQCKQIFANLSDYLDGALDEMLCAELERHIRTCKTCQAFLLSLRESIEQTHSIALKVPDPQIAAQARIRIARRMRNSTQ
jgi:RNA polymerase sigma-70 factor, ECF subfamily